MLEITTLSREHAKCTCWSPGDRSSRAGVRPGGLHFSIFLFDVLAAGPGISSESRGIAGCFSVERETREELSFEIASPGPQETSPSCLHSPAPYTPASLSELRFNLHPSKCAILSLACAEPGGTQGLKPARQVLYHRATAQPPRALTLQAVLGEHPQAPPPPRWGCGVLPHPSTPSPTALQVTRILTPTSVPPLGL